MVAAIFGLEDLSRPIQYYIRGHFTFGLVTLKKKRIFAKYAKKEASFTELPFRLFVRL